MICRSGVLLTLWNGDELFVSRFEKIVGSFAGGGCPAKEPQGFGDSGRLAPAVLLCSCYNNLVE